MKKLQIAFVWLIILTATNLRAQTWSTLTTGTTSKLRCVDFPVPNIGYASGEDGTILKSNDTGTTWHPVISGYTGYTFWKLHFINADTGYVGGEGPAGGAPSGPGIILKTANGGTTWTTCTSGTAYPVRDLYAVNYDTVYACGGAEALDGHIIKSVDRGLTWSIVGPAYYDAMLQGLYFLNSNVGFLGMYESVFGSYFPTTSSWLGTTTGGTTFTTTNNPGSTSYWRFSTDFYGVSTGYSSRANGTIADSVYIRKTTDGGTTWNEHTITGYTGNLNSLKFISATIGYIVGNGGHILKTTDGAVTWVPQISSTTQELNSVYFVNSTLGFAAGDNGTIVKYSATSVSCDTVTGLSISAITPTSAHLNWSAVPGSAGYEYVVNTTSTSPTAPGTPTTATSATVTGLLPAHAYYAHVRNNCGSGNMSLWVNKPFSTLSSTGSENTRIDRDISIFPNPVQDNLTIEIEDNVNAAFVTITDITGKPILSMKLSSKMSNIDITGVPQGIYIVRYSDELQVKTMKIIKN